MKNENVSIESLSIQLLDLVTEVEKIKTGIFFVNDVVEGLDTQNDNFKKSNSLIDLNILQHEVSRILPHIVSFTANAIVDSEKTIGKLCKISDEVEDLEREQKNSLE
ncbi:hypothetical protein [Carnobacterium funditum]|uniref:hypothetical protein n=1 Tax=Carnobacterium funditum TaxID=2752 RepID=UPI0005578716|nr:hypothetical protein [Carnobacterium funditum]